MTSCTDDADETGPVTQKTADYRTDDTAETSHVAGIRVHGIRSGRTPVDRGTRDGRRCPTVAHGSAVLARLGTGRTGSPCSAWEADGTAATWKVRREGCSHRNAAEDDWIGRPTWEQHPAGLDCRQTATAVTRCFLSQPVSYTHLTLPTKRIV